MSVCAHAHETRIDFYVFHDSTNPWRFNETQYRIIIVGHVLYVVYYRRRDTRVVFKIYHNNIINVYYILNA